MFVPARSAKVFISMIPRFDVLFTRVVGDRVVGHVGRPWKREFTSSCVFFVCVFVEVLRGPFCLSTAPFWEVRAYKTSCSGLLRQESLSTTLDELTTNAKSTFCKPTNILYRNSRTGSSRLQLTNCEHDFKTELLSLLMFIAHEQKIKRKKKKKSLKLHEPQTGRSRHTAVSEQRIVRLFNATFALRLLRAVYEAKWKVH